MSQWQSYDDVYKGRYNIHGKMRHGLISCSCYLCITSYNDLKYNDLKYNDLKERERAIIKVNTYHKVYLGNS